MNKTAERALTTALTLCAVLSAFYLRGDGDTSASSIPVERVFVAVSPAPDLYAQRQAQREQELAALADPSSGEALQALVERAETELAVEQALSALGYPRAVCALRRNAAAICVAESLSPEDARKICALCARLAEIDEENVFILDECAYL